jgi:hypothetical protein
MTMDKPNKKPSDETPKITVDYDDPDVEDIMRQIQAHTAPRAKTAEAQGSEERRAESEPPGSPERGESTSSASHLPEPVLEPLPLTGAKRLLLKVMRPFSPLIKLLILPVHRELIETVHRLDFTNRRLDFINARFEAALEALSRELYGSTAVLDRKVDEFNDATNLRLDKAVHDLGRTMEYTKLLHSLSHNLVVELSKLKIEEEDLKVKTRIMEKDFEFLRSKENALEKQVFK